MGHREIGSELDGTLQTLDRLLDQPCGAIRFPEIGMSGGIIRLQRQGSANPLDGQVVPARLLGDNTVVVQRFRVAGLDGENLAVEILRFHQASRLVVLLGQSKSLGSRHRQQDGFAAHHCRHMAR